jgi:hypothetical protein
MANADPFAVPYGETQPVYASPAADVADALFLPYGEDVPPPPSRWVDRTDEAGERTHAGRSFNILLLHEELVRACCSTHAGGNGMVTPLLHERCSLHVKDAAFLPAAPELQSPAVDRSNTIALLRRLALAPAVRMEPAEILPDGSTRVHWLDDRGARYGQCAPPPRPLVPATHPALCRMRSTWIAKGLRRGVCTQHVDGNHPTSSPLTHSPPTHPPTQRDVCIQHVDGSAVFQCPCPRCRVRRMADRVSLLIPLADRVPLLPPLSVYRSSPHR